VPDLDREIDLVDVPLLLAAISANSPCGEDLEYDAEFLQLERDALGKPERVMGDSVQPGEPPQWRKIEQSSTALLQRTKDLRITHYLLQSALALDGVTGLCNALVLTRDLLTQYWADLYPQLDADDDNDPTVRINALAGLTCDINIQLLRESVLVRSRAFGPVSLRALLNAGGLQNFADERLTPEELSGALQDADVEQLASIRGSLSDALAAAHAIEEIVSGQVGSAHGVDLSALKQPLKQALQILGEPALESNTDETLISESDAGEEPASDPRPPSAARVPGSVGSREDVLRSLDLILGYYARHEPSSPLPVLLSRAKLLVSADFATIVRNLIPDGMNQFENLRGPEAE
jgi:type VI secretion system protein ImpA